MTTAVQVDCGDPHNDQVLAMTADDLRAHMNIVRGVLDQAEEADAPLSAIVAVIATHWINNEHMTRERVSSLLALALVKAHVHELQEASAEFEEFMRRIIS